MITRINCSLDNLYRTALGVSLFLESVPDVEDGWYTFICEYDNFYMLYSEEHCYFVEMEKQSPINYFEELPENYSDIIREEIPWYFEERPAVKPDLHKYLEIVQMFYLSSEIPEIKDIALAIIREIKEII